MACGPDVRGDNGSCLMPADLRPRGGPEPEYGLVQGRGVWRVHALPAGRCPGAGACEGLRRRRAGRPGGDDGSEVLRDHSGSEFGIHELAQFRVRAHHGLFAGRTLFDTRPAAGPVSRAGAKRHPADAVPAVPGSQSRCSRAGGLWIASRPQGSADYGRVREEMGAGDSGVVRPLRREGCRLVVRRRLRTHRLPRGDRAGVCGGGQARQPQGHRHLQPRCQADSLDRGGGLHRRRIERAVRLRADRPLGGWFPVARPDVPRLALGRQGHSLLRRAVGRLDEVGPGPRRSGHAGYGTELRSAGGAGRVVRRRAGDAGSGDQGEAGCDLGNEVPASSETGRQLLRPALRFSRGHRLHGDRQEHHTRNDRARDRPDAARLHPDRLQGTSRPVELSDQGRQPGARLRRRSAPAVAAGHRRARRRAVHALFGCLGFGGDSPSSGLGRDECRWLEEQERHFLLRSLCRPTPDSATAGAGGRLRRRRRLGGWRMLGVAAGLWAGGSEGVS